LAGGIFRPFVIWTGEGMSLTHHSRFTTIFWLLPAGDRRGFESQLPDNVAGHSLDAIIVEIVPNAGSLENGIPDDAEELLMQRMIPIVNRLMPKFLVGKRYVLQPFKYHPIRVHLITKFDESRHLPEVFELISEGKLKLRNDPACTQFPEKFHVLAKDIVFTEPSQLFERFLAGRVGRDPNRLNLVVNSGKLVPLVPVEKDPVRYDFKTKIRTAVIIGGVTPV
jgi:hypothetical protein